MSASHRADHDAAVVGSAAAEGVTVPPLRTAARWRPEVVLCAVGLFFASSDRFLALNLGSLTLKPSYPFFALAAGLVAGRTVVRPPPLRRSPWPGFTWAVAGLVACYLAASVVSLDPVTSVVQMLVIAGGALLPFVAVALAPRVARDVDRLITALVSGTIAAATFGFYQFGAATIGLPLPVGLRYDATVAGLGRISAWSYEPAFYVFHLELTLAVVVGDVIAGRRRFGVRPELPALYLLLSLVLANARVGFVSFPLLVLAVFWSSGTGARFDRRALRFVRLAVAGGALVVLAGLPFGVNFPAYVLDRLVSVTDTGEVASNAPRVDLYSVAAELAAERPMLGYGPGASGTALVERFPLYTGVDPRSAPANNLVLQAVLDAGVVALPFLIAAVAAIAIGSRRNPSRDGRILLAGATVVLLVNAQLASFFWDLRLWVVLGLAYAAARVRITSDTDEMTYWWWSSRR